MPDGPNTPARGDDWGEVEGGSYTVWPGVTWNEKEDCRAH